MRSRIFAVLLVALLLVVPSSVRAFTGKLVKVLDGDTVEVLHDRKPERIRLAEIDCPEGDQPFGKAAKRFVLDLAAGKIVTVHPQTTDRYGRTVAEVILPDGQSLGRELVRAGYAWWFRRYSDNQSLEQLEQEARNARSGLWSDPNAVAPWDWRKGLREPVQAAGPADTVRSCGTKRFCKQMSDCSEARYYLTECGVSSLDRDGDGVPCEAICR